MTSMVDLALETKCPLTVVLSFTTTPVLEPTSVFRFRWQQASVTCVGEQDDLFRSMGLDRNLR